MEVKSHHDTSFPIELPRVDKAVGHPKAVVTIGFSSSDESDDAQKRGGASISRASSSTGAWSPGTTAADIVAQDLQVDPDDDSDSSV